MIKIGKVYINLLLFALIAAAYVTNSLFELCVSYICVTLHELSHMFAALYYKIDVNGFVIMPFGVSLRLKESQISEPMHECAVCVAGPAMNLVLALAALFFRMHSVGNLRSVDFFISSNLAIFLINIIPIVPLDGGRIFRAFMTSKFGFIRAAKTANVISQINIALIGALGIYVLYVTHFNVSIMLICTFLIFNMSSEKRNNELALMRQIVHSKKKLAESEMMRVRELAVTGDVSVRRLLKSFSYDCYYIVNVIDKDMKIRRCLTETQIINAASHTAKNETIDKLFDKFTQPIVLDRKVC